MKQIKKRKHVIFLVSVILIITCMLVITGCSESKEDEIPIPTIKEDVYVYDVDNIIEDNVENKINTLLIQLEDKTEAEVCVITVESLLGKEIEDYSYELANTLGIGKGDEDNGVLLLISKTDGRVRLEIGKGLEGCLNDSKCGRILDDYFVPHRQKDEYSEGTYKTIEAVVSVIAREYGVKVGDVDDTLVQEIEQEEESTGTIIWIIIIIVILILVFGALFADDDSFGSYSGGSSFSGGSSHGGFGGGSFGGGGASR